MTKLSTSSGRGRLLFGAATLGAMLVGACAKPAMAPEDGGLTAQDGAAIIDEPPWDDDLISDFEDTTAAIVLRLGWPLRNGFWYTYNDASHNCTQTPKPGIQAQSAGMKPVTYVGGTPPSPPNGPSGGRALRAQWKGCTAGGAGIAADFNAGMNLDGTLYTGPKVAYDIHAYTGITFWAMATANTDVNVRVNLPMLKTVKVADGGTCDEADAGVGKCGDQWGETITLPAGKWSRVTMRFADTGFKQQGTGAVTPWDPVDVVGVQIQSVDANQTYDFWIDDVYFVRPPAP